MIITFLKNQTYNATYSLLTLQLYGNEDTPCNTPGEIICLTSAIANACFALLHISFFNPLKNLLHLSISIGPLVGYLAFSFIKHKSAATTVDETIARIETSTTPAPSNQRSQIRQKLLELYPKHKESADGQKIRAMIKTLADTTNTDPLDTTDFENKTLKAEIDALLTQT